MLATPDTTSDWWKEMERDMEAKPSKPRPINCADGFCGADDCQRCHPWAGFYNQKPEDQATL